MELSSSDSIAILSFSEQPEYPRLSRDVLRELRDQMRVVRSSEAFRGIVIASNSRSFAVGARLEEVTELNGVDAFEFARFGQTVFRDIARSPLPVVAAIRGLCLGGGLDLALACHGRVAAYDSSFGSPGATLGLVTGWGGTWRLPRRAGRSTALQMLVTGERIPAAQALTAGLVDELAPPADLLPAAVRQARAVSLSRRPGVG
ncbi:MAG TPA: enoyl-CoA hydratase/isomerase family protein [Terriglobia bacterium]|nr:enoyl-CoA hydratase/isomerase family protein [Terriglobia bacterium]